MRMLSRFRNWDYMVDMYLVSFERAFFAYLARKRVSFHNIFIVDTPNGITLFERPSSRFRFSMLDFKASALFMILYVLLVKGFVIFNPIARILNRIFSVFFVISFAVTSNVIQVFANPLFVTIPKSVFIFLIILPLLLSYLVFVFYINFRDTLATIFIEPIPFILIFSKITGRLIQLTSNAFFNHWNIIIPKAV